MIIAISGYAGSGKDLIAKMIQFYYTPDKHPDFTFEQFMQRAEEFKFDEWIYYDNSGWEVKKYAGKLKQIASMLTGIPVEKFEDQAFKKTNLNSEWSYTTEEVTESGIWKKTHYMSVRDFLQKLGTDGLRDGLHTNVWVNALMADYVPVHQQWTDGPLDIHKYGLLPNWIITDCRFPNEAEAVKKHDGLIIRINRPGVTAVNAHPSETALDDYPFDAVIENDGSIAELYEKVKFTIEKQNVCYP